MNYEELRFIDIKKVGQKLGNKRLAYPVLYKGIVYKTFDVQKDYFKLSELYREKERLMLTLDKLNLKYLTKVRSILTNKNKPYGYTYEYNDSPIMKDYLETKHNLKTRLTYISEILETHEKLLAANLSYIDYHSGNFLMDKEIIFIDIDSIIDKNTFKAKYIKEYLFTLIISIYLNYDLTSTVDLAPYLDILSDYFDTSLYDFDLLDLHKVFEEMLTKDASLVPILARKIYDADVKSYF